MTDKPQKLRIANRDFNSRLIMGTGKFASGEIMASALEASGAELVTVALRRADLSGQGDKFANILTFLDAKKYVLLPNTSGARNAEEACRLARLGREATRLDLAETRNPSRPALLVAGCGGDVEGGGDPGEGRVHRAAVHQCRPRPREAARRCWLRDGDAAGFADRQRPRASKRGRASRSSSNRRRCPSWSMRGWARRRMRRRRWRWARMLCW